MSRRQTHGTLLQLSDGAASNPVFATVAYVRTIKPPSINRGITALADHDMVDSMEYLPNGLAELGGADFKLYMDPQNVAHKELYALVKSGEQREWKVILPNSAGEWDFTAFVTKFDVGDIDANSGVLEADCSLQAVAAPELT